MSTKFYKLKIKEVTKETSDSISISFDIPAELNDKFTYKAGQYLTLKTNLGGEDIRRAYSISSAPYQNEWKVVVKQIEDGRFSTFAQSLVAGDELEVMPPAGNFIVKDNEVKNRVLFAAGSGITPVISIIKDVLQKNSENKIVLFYGNRAIDTIIYKNELDALANANSNLKIHYLLESGIDGVLNGIVDSNRLPLLVNEFLGGLSIDDIYICGPEPMIYTIKDYFTANNVNEKNIHFELFTVSTATKEEVIDESVEIMSHVKVIIDDEEFEFDLSSKGKYILQAAQDADADVPFSCKGGVCCTCKAKVLEGKVKMDLNFALDEDEVNEGFVLTCQAKPLTENVVLSYDEY